MTFLFILCAFVLPTFAGLETLKIKNLSTEYASPSGTGEMDKIEIDLSKTERTPFSLVRHDDAIIIQTAMMDFTWSRPEAFFLEIKKFGAIGLNVQLAKGESFLTGQGLELTTGKDEFYSLTGMNVNCRGSSTERDPLMRFVYDCEEKAEVVVNKLELPFDLLDQVASRLPPIPDDAEMPADDLKISIYKGDIFATLKIKYMVRATVKIWGHFQFENDRKVAALRVDQVKFGILTVTNLVMNELRRQINHPNVTIDPPWIRIKLE